MKLLNALQILAALHIGICNGQQKTLPPEKITAEQLHLFAKYAERAYCEKIYSQPLGKPLCPEGSEPAKSKCKGLGNAAIVHRFKYEWGNVPGYMTTDADKKLIVVAFRGTDKKSMANIMVDLTKIEVRSIFNNRELCEGCWLHSGFTSAFTDMSTPVENDLRKELDKMGRKGVRVVVTGHSLGGAIATIAGAYLRTKFPDVWIDIYAYGSPRVGNKAFTNFVEEQKNGVTVRVTKKSDFVTSIPQHVPHFFDYTHIYPEVWFKEGLKDVDAFENPYENSDPKLCSVRRCGSDSCGPSLIDWKLSFTCTAGDHSGYAGNFSCSDDNKEDDEDPRDETSGDELQIYEEIQTVMTKMLAEQFLLFAAHAVQPAYKGSERLCDVLRLSGNPHVEGLCSVRVTRMTSAQKENLLVLSFHEPVRSSTLTKELKSFSLVCPGCQVNRDFLQALGPILPPSPPLPASPSRKDLYWAVETLKKKYESEKKPVQRVVFTGYCGGGAMATLAAAFFRKLDSPVDLYTYGSPRVGNEAFAKFVTDYDKAISARITGGGHKVVLTPGKTDGYSHYGPEFYFPQGLANADSGKNLRICRGIEAEGCSVVPQGSSGSEGKGVSAVGRNTIYPSEGIWCSSFDPSAAV
ncbi:hypothetical protein CP532_6379 [Ophiocordyceps camponoti-leonardi (nom. inval.)]|nr:hypothetical protein CP532_6379 [Ophiocordyceps camponoti-leonardi (nom. inval.)]